MSWIGDFRLNDTFDFKFTTIQVSGAPATLSGSPTIAAYPANSTTEITAGITLNADFDSRTGLNQVRTVATSGNGYATATDYDMVITSGTVNSVSVVGYVVASFSIEHRSALMPATAGRTLVVDAAGLGDANTVKLGPSGSGTAQTARDIGTSILLSNGTGTGQISLLAGAVLLQATQAGVTIPTVTTITNAAGITSNLKKNQALAKYPFIMTDSTTHAPKTGVTVTATRSLDGGAFAACANSAAEVANGDYTIDLAATDLNANTVMLRLTGTSCDDRLISLVTQP